MLFHFDFQERGTFNKPYTEHEDKDLSFQAKTKYYETNTINDCWDLCETSNETCDAISFNHLELECHLFHLNITNFDLIEKYGTSIFIREGINSIL